MKVFIKLKLIYDNENCAVGKFEEFLLIWPFLYKKFVPDIHPNVYYICG